jgi:hypothetical protein
MKTGLSLFLGALLVAMTYPAASQENTSPIINLIVDVDVPPSPTRDQARTAELSLHDVYSDIRRRNGTGTILLTQDVTSSRIRLILAQYTFLSNFEFAISGQHSNDQLSTMSLPDQEDLLATSLDFAKAARVCGLTAVEVLGFMPPGFNQNEDTYIALDKLGIQYNAGFQAGLIFAPGHEEDVWPYLVEGYNFYAIPISTVEISGELVPLSDRTMNERGMNSSDWQDLLTAKLDDSKANGYPMVVLLSTSTSGTGDYFDALTRFLDYAVSENAIFVNARDLVTFAKTGNLTLPYGGMWECSECGQDEGIEINITREELEPESSTNETIDNTIEKIQVAEDASI